uniref:Uncharacterized protein n=1 Tax=Cacopsylla melanoneura TaxID=428564 RepID=A0A8D9BJR0_9HEMI
MNYLKKKEKKFKEIKFLFSSGKKRYLGHSSFSTRGVWGLFSSFVLGRRVHFYCVFTMYSMKNPRNIFHQHKFLFASVIPAMKCKRKKTFSVFVDFKTVSL